MQFDQILNARLMEPISNKNWYEKILIQLIAIHYYRYNIIIQHYGRMKNV